MKDKKLTPWFSGAVRPARVGVYERMGSAHSFARWDGRRWLIRPCAGEPEQESIFQPYIDKGADFSWRGLTKEPK